MKHRFLSLSFSPLPFICHRLLSYEGFPRLFSLMTDPSALEDHMDSHFIEVTLMSRGSSTVVAVLADVWFKCEHVDQPVGDQIACLHTFLKLWQTQIWAVWICPPTSNRWLWSYPNVLIVSKAVLLLLSLEYKTRTHILIVVILKC